MSNFVSTTYVPSDDVENISKMYLEVHAENLCSSEKPT
jgi:hypothetical protein